MPDGRSTIGFCYRKPTGSGDDIHEHKESTKQQTIQSSNL
jgi:hypothetical protein